MSDHRTSDGPPNELNRRMDRSTLLGVLTGGAVLVGSMLVLAAVAVLLGWMQRDETGSINLGPWLALEVLGGAAASVLAGWVCRNISHRLRGPVVLALVVCSVGLLEAVEILHYIKGNTVKAPIWLVLIAPFVAASGILLGGFRRSQGDAVGIAQSLTARLTTVWRYAIPVAVLLAATLLALFVLPTQTNSQTTVLASALTLDLTVTFPGLVYLFLVRTRRLPWIAIVPSVVLGYFAATLAIPDAHHDLLENLRLLVIPVELTVVTYLLIRARRIFLAIPEGSGDFVTRFRSATADMLGSRVAAGIFATEIGILYHAFKWRTPPVANATCYTVHRKSGYGSVLFGLFIALLVEAIALHFLISQWSHTAAWILTGLTGYAVVWFVGDYRAFRARPILITPTDLRVRVGLRWEIRVDMDNLREIRVHLSQKEKSSDALSAVVLGKANVCLKLVRPVEAVGMYGIRKSTSEIWLQVDDADRLYNELQASQASR